MTHKSVVAYFDLSGVIVLTASQKKVNSKSLDLLRMHKDSGRELRKIQGSCNHEFHIEKTSIAYFDTKYIRVFEKCVICEKTKRSRKIIK